MRQSYTKKKKKQNKKHSKTLNGGRNGTRIQARKIMQKKEETKVKKTELCNK